jgi:preprotein translocase subunit SecD
LLQPRDTGGTSTTSCETDSRPTQQARAAGPWSELQVIPLDPPQPSTAQVQAELDRVGGSSALFEISVDDLRKQLLDSLRGDVSKTLREARLVWSRAPAVRNGVVEAEVRDPVDVERALRALESFFAPPGGYDADRLAVVTNAGDRILRITPNEAVIAERVRVVRASALWLLQRRANELGVTIVSIKAEGDRGVRVVLPGVGDPRRLLQILDMRARLEFRFIDTSMNPCDAVKTQPPVDSEVLYSDVGRTPYVVHKQAVILNMDLIDAVAALDRVTGEPFVAFRLDNMAAGRFAQAVRMHIGQPLAIVLDNRILATPVVVEPLDRSIRISGAFTVQAAKEFALLLRGAGAPYARLNVIESQTIAPKAAK